MNILDTIVDFIYKYFIDPIRYHSGYNIVNTITYAIIFAICTYFGIKLLNKLNIKIDKKLILSLIPFMVFGGSSRALVDANVYPDTPLLITPGIYVTIALITILSMVVITILRERKGIDFHKNIMTVGSVFASINLLLVVMNIKRPLAIIYIVGIFAIVYLPILLASNKWKTFLTGNEYLLGAHIFDATTTFCGIYFYDYIEQHVLTGFFIDKLGPVVMFPIKIVFITLSLYLLESIIPEKDIANLDIKNILKLVILILGLGPGIRNMCTIIMAA